MTADFASLTAGAYQDQRELNWVYEQHLVKLQPTRVIEIGVAMGGTTRLFLDLVGPNGLVLGIDVSKELIAPDVATHPRFELVLGSSYDPRVVSQVRARLPECDLLLIDGDHTDAGVMKDTECYLPLVREGGLVLWHDVRLESPEGIKNTWYKLLKPRFHGASEYFVDPFNTGFGIWYKSRHDAASRLQDAQLALAAGDISGAQQAVQAVLAADAQNAAAWRIAAVVFAAAGARAEAQHAALTALALCPDESDELVATFQDPAAPDVAVDLCLAALAKRSHGARTLQESARIFLRRGFFHNAKEAARRALTLEPDQPDAHLLLLDVLQADPASLRTELVEAVLSALEVTRDRVDARAQHSRLVTELAPSVGAALLRLQKWQEVPVFVENVLTRAPDFALHGAEQMATALFIAAQRLASLDGVVSTYERTFLQCARLAGTSASQAALHFVRTLRYRQHAGQARQLAQVLAAQWPEDAALGQECASTLLDQGRDLEAQRLYRRLQLQSPEDAAVRYQLAATATATDADGAALKQQVLAWSWAARDPLELAAVAHGQLLDHWQKFRCAQVKRALDRGELQQLQAAFGPARAEMPTDHQGLRLSAAALSALQRYLRGSALQGPLSALLGPDWYLHKEALLTSSPSGSVETWRQPSRENYEPWRSISCWLALDVCDSERPGFGIVSYPFSTLLAGPSESVADSRPTGECNARYLIAETRWTPHFEPGDLLLFDRHTAFCEYPAGAAPPRHGVHFRLQPRDRRLL